MGERYFSLDGSDLDDLLRVVRSEFDEMPGLSLTPDQAGRLWAQDPVVCRRVLGRLVECGYLGVNDLGMYVRPTAA